MGHNRPIVLSIAGFDPSGGAGVLADIKTLEQHRCQGMAAVSAWTIQTEDAFIDISWLNPEQIWAQAAPLLDRYPIRVVKIGIIENLSVLDDIICRIRRHHPQVRIIWDPVISASASGFRFLQQIDQDLLSKVLQQICLLTPNVPEALLLSSATEQQEAGQYLSTHCAVYLKGGHSAHKGMDLLFVNNKVQAFAATDNHLPPKHGSGCILSSAIAARLALGDRLEDACSAAKNYIETILASNPSLLAYHHV